MGWDMGLLRWLLLPHRSKRDDDDEERPRKKKGRSAHPSAYRIEVDGEARHMRGEGPPFSFWSSSRVILILAFFLWWIQPAGPMIAGYVGGRRAGSPGKAVIAALVPVIAIYIANLSYARIFSTHQVDFVAYLPNALGSGAASILPFLAPYKDFMITYLQSFVSALQVTFGMGTNGYLMVILFSYIGGLIAEQTRRELNYRSGAPQSIGLNLIQPMFGRPHPMAEAYEEEDEELESMRRPVRARAYGRTAARGSRRRGQVTRFDDYRPIGAETEEDRGGRRTTRSHGHAEEDEEEEEAPVRSRHGSHARAQEHRVRIHIPVPAENVADDQDDAEAEARREAKEARAPKKRSHDEEVAIQRFVERALRNYDHSKL